MADDSSDSGGESDKLYKAVKGGYLCTSCGNVIKGGLSKLEKHMERMHPQLVGRTAKKKPICGFYCNKCHKTIEGSLVNFKEHMRKFHTTKKVHKCKDCGRGYTTERALNKHMKRERAMRERMEGGVERSEQEKRRKLAEIRQQAREFFMDAESKVGRLPWEKRKTKDQPESDDEDGDDDESDEDDDGELEDYVVQRYRKTNKGYGRMPEREGEAMETTDESGSATDESGSDESIVLHRQPKQAHRILRKGIKKKAVKTKKRSSAKPKKRHTRRRLETSDSDDSGVDQLTYLDAPAVRKYVKRRPIIVQISGPRTREQGGISNVPTNYQESDKLRPMVEEQDPPPMRQLQKQVIVDSDDDHSEHAGVTGLQQTAGVKPSGRGEASGVGVEYNFEGQRMSILKDRIGGNPLIGEKSWVDWSPILTFFACIATFLLNRRDEANIVYKKLTAVKKEAKKLMSDAKQMQFALKTRGKFNLKIVLDLSDHYEIIMNVWSTKKRLLVNDCRNIDVFKFERPQLEILRTESGRFCVITKLGQFIGRQVCENCFRKFSNRRRLWDHKKMNRCPYQRFLDRFPERTREDFFKTRYEEYMIERSFPRGKIRPHQTIEEKLQAMYINMPLNFQLKRYFCVSDIESFLRPLPHKYIHGEEEVIYGDLEGLTFTDIHQPSAISAVSNLGESYSASQCFINMDGSSSFIENYCRYLYEMADYQYTLLRQEHDIIFEQLDWKEKQFEEQGRDAWFVSKIRKLRKDIEEDAKKLVVYFFNASYDLNCLIRHGLCWYLEMIENERAELEQQEKEEEEEEEEGENSEDLQEDDDDDDEEEESQRATPKKVRPVKPRGLKNGNDYIMVTSKRIIFRDILKFCPGKVSLPAFLYSYGIEDKYSKMAFPYKLLRSHKDMWIQTKDITYEDFFSDLKQENVLNSLYDSYCYLLEHGMDSESALKELKRTEVPQPGRELFQQLQTFWIENEMKYLYTYLALYCNTDCRSLVVAIEKMQTTVFILINPHSLILPHSPIVPHPSSIMKK